jgi:hypothetical protein
LNGRDGLAEKFINGRTEGKNGIRATTMVNVMAGNVDAEVTVHGGKNVLGPNRSLFRFRSLGIGLAHYPATYDPATGN